ncbi:hypothetical protein GCM10025857_35810 [Alicyclobacillus contaminans]|nr:hypothetical protein GCM10025857_35810 [Alicyclobacillus contaminans]
MAALGVFQLFRVVTALPGMMVASRLLLTQDIRWLWAFAVVIGTGLAVAVPMLAMRSWETYYDMGAVRSLKNLALPADMESRSQLHPWMKRPSQWLVGGVERLLHRPLQPMVWWILLRSLRRQGTLRDLWLLTMAALTSAFGPRGLPSRWCAWLSGYSWPSSGGGFAFAPCMSPPSNSSRW